MAASPGSYDPNDSFTKTKMPSIGFGSSKRQPLNIDNKAPGPGEYKLGSKAFSNTRFHMGIKLTTKDKEHVPGPGEYSAKRNEGVPKYSMGAKCSPTKDVTKVPGPGSYAPNTTAAAHSAPKYGFGSSKR